MANHRRRLVSDGKEDRISNLPEHLIGSILERLPVQSAVSSSILSKKWRYQWTTMRALVFDWQFFKKYRKNGAFGLNGFIRIINQILFLHDGPVMNFYLQIPNLFLDSFKEVDQWILFLSRNGVKELTLVNLNRRYELPSYFSCVELRKLELHNCIFKPLQLEGFCNLEHLVLFNTEFCANSSRTLVSLPQLERLTLDTCTNVYNFNIKVTKLQTLILISCPDAILLPLLESPYLALVRITFMKPIEDLSAERMSLATMLSLLPKIKHFSTDGYFLKVLDANMIPKRLPHALNNLKRLKFRNFQLGDMDLLHGALCLLRSSPNLRSLCIFVQVQMQPQVMHDDVGLVSNHLEALDCFDQTLNHLHTVEILSIEGSKPELLFIKLLLAHSPSLKEMTIQPSGTSDADKRHNIAKDVIRFPRASTKAEIIYLDPNP